MCTVWGTHALATMEARGQLARAGSFCHAGHELLLLISPAGTH